MDKREAVPARRINGNPMAEQAERIGAMAVAEARMLGWKPSQGSKAPLPWASLVLCESGWRGQRMALARAFLDLGADFGLPCRLGLPSAWLLAIDAPEEEFDDDSLAELFARRPQACLHARLSDELRSCAEQGRPRLGIELMRLAGSIDPLEAIRVHSMPREPLDERDEPGPLEAAADCRHWDFAELIARSCEGSEDGVDGLDMLGRAARRPWPCAALASILAKRSPASLLREGPDGLDPLAAMIVGNPEAAKSLSQEFPWLDPLESARRIAPGKSRLAGLGYPWSRALFEKNDLDSQVGLGASRGGSGRI